MLQSTGMQRVGHNLALNNNNDTLGIGLETRSTVAAKTDRQVVNTAYDVRW